jgi:broad specificity phosphatase PhoE
LTTRLSLICNASTSATRSFAFPADEPLDPRLSRELTALPSLRDADRFWTSPALRAVQTARALLLDAAVDPLLRDCDYGRWAGLSFDDVQAREPKAVADWMRDPAAAPHGGESTLALIERVAVWLDAQRETPGRVVAVTHAAVIRAAVIYAIGATAASMARIDIAPLSVVRLSGHDGRWNLIALGERAGG